MISQEVKNALLSSALDAIELATASNRVARLVQSMVTHYAEGSQDIDIARAAAATAVDDTIKLADEIDATDAELMLAMMVSAAKGGEE